MKFVVARHCHGGIGDHLSCLIGAWWLAKRTGRRLVVDWRGSQFNPDASLTSNCFSRYFESCARLGGVEVVADDQVGNFRYPEPLWPSKWTAPALASRYHMKHSADEVIQLNRLVNSNEDREEPTVIINQWVDFLPHIAPQEFISELQFADSIRTEASRFWAENVGSAQAIAIHIRHGNGENVGARAAYWLGPIALMRQLSLNIRNDLHAEGLAGEFADNMPKSLVGTLGQTLAEERFCRHIATQVDGLRERLGLRDAVPFLFCDSGRVIEIFRSVMPSTVVRPKQLRPVGEGPLHQIRSRSVKLGEQDGVLTGTVDQAVALDMFVELELMRRCAGLVYMDSGFSLLARLGLGSDRLHRLRPALANRMIVRVASYF